MRHEFTKTGLRIIADAQDRLTFGAERYERQVKGESFGTFDDESNALEALVANSELEWIPEGATADLTSAPMLGILGETCVWADLPPANFGLIQAGHWHDADWYQPILARYAYMDYQVRSFLDDLIEKGYADFEGQAVAEETVGGISSPL